MTLFEQYQKQSEIVAEEKAKLKKLNDQLQVFRVTCQHNWKDGACWICGMNQTIHELVEAETKLVGDQEAKFMRTSK